MRKILNWFLGALVVAGALFLHYSLPFHDVVRVVGDEVVTERVAGDASGEVVPQDVRFVNAVDEADAPHVYRNEDTGWGWPPYFKFDSADLAARADEAADGEDDAWHRVTSYGWRIPFLSMFPNIVGIEAAEGPAAETFPWTALVVFLLYLGAILWAARLLLRWRGSAQRRRHADA